MKRREAASDVASTTSLPAAGAPKGTAQQGSEEKYLDGRQWIFNWLYVKGPFLFFFRQFPGLVDPFSGPLPRPSVPGQLTVPLFALRVPSSEELASMRSVSGSILTYSPFVKSSLSRIGHDLRLRSADCAASRRRRCGNTSVLPVQWQRHPCPLPALANCGFHLRSEGTADDDAAPSAGDTVLFHLKSSCPPAHPALPSRRASRQSRTERKRTESPCA